MICPSRLVSVVQIASLLPSAFLPYDGLSNSLVMRDLFGSLPAFAWDNIPIRLITKRLSLSPISFTRNPIGQPCGLLSRAWEDYGLTTFRMSTFVWVRSDLSAGGAISTMSELGTPILDHLPFGSSVWREFCSRTSIPFACSH